MFNHFKSSWGHYITLVVVASIVAALSAWIYQDVLHRFGQGPAFVALTISIFAIAFLAVFGAVLTLRFESFRRGQNILLMAPSRLETNIYPFIMKTLGRDFFRQSETAFEFAADVQVENGAVNPLGTEPPRQSRGRKLHHPEERKREAVLKWEKLGGSSSGRKLSDFLEDEFGTAQDGTLIVPPSAFYMWRKRFLDKNRNERDNQEGS